jgi:hypothetical protein
MSMKIVLHCIVLRFLEQSVAIKYGKKRATNVYRRMTAAYSIIILCQVDLKYDLI